MMSHYNFYVNHAYAQLFVAASSVAIVLWSVSPWGRRARELRSFDVHQAQFAHELRVSPSTGRLWIAHAKSANFAYFALASFRMGGGFLGLR